MKHCWPLILILCCSSPGAEPKFSPDEAYALFVSAIAKCKAAYPGEEADYDKTRRALVAFFESKKELSGALTNPAVPDLVKGMDVEMDKYLNTARDRRSVCAGVKKGEFGIISFPVDR